MENQKGLTLTLQSEVWPASDRTASSGSCVDCDGNRWGVHESSICFLCGFLLFKKPECRRGHRCHFSFLPNTLSSIPRSTPPEPSCFTRGPGKPRSSSWTGGLGVGRNNDGEAADSPDEPKGKAGKGWLYNGGGEEDSHAGQDDNGAEVLE